ncbi:uncharacterized protein LOC125609617 [Brassica napus]|uniref:uncharacterized protein LOC125609617 n=1 Tax=Brassica napus TaxID=3708 RepID=UPI00207900EC|nr:uncharacterized protein LOC125609617 [Brassica napus]
MSSSSSNDLEERLDEIFDEICEDTFNNIEAQTNKQRKRTYIERNREAGHNRLWNDYFSDNPAFEPHLFRRRFRMNKELFLHIVHSLSVNVPFFQQRRDATGRSGLSPLQKCTAAIRMLAYGSAADAVDEYLRLGTLNDINVLDRSPVFEDITEGRAPRLEYVVNGHKYKFAYYLTDGPKAELFVKTQEAARKYVERTFGVLQARFAIVKNPALTWDKEKTGKIMRACIIIHNMIVENEHNGYTRIDISELEEGSVTRSSQVETETDRPTNLNNMFVNQNQKDLRDRRIHEQLKKDLIEHI